MHRFHTSQDSPPIRLPDSLVPQTDAEQRHLAEIETLAGQLEVRNRFIQGVFGRYVSDEVVEAVLATPEGLSLGGEKRTVTLLMSDLRGFSALAERRSPEDVVRIVNNALGTMGDVVLSHGGTVDEFLGDSVLAFFGAPVRRDDDARRGLTCALAMQRAMETVNACNREQGLPEVESGIAVHTGEVVGGNIGSERRTKYGAGGSHVNLTARIEGYTLGGQVLASQATLSAAGAGFRLAASLAVRAKGVSEPVRVFEVTGLDGRDDLTLASVLEPSVPAEPPVPVLLTVLDEKRIGLERSPGALVRLSPRGAELAADVLPQPWDDLALVVPGASGEAYAKVLAAPAFTPGAVRIRFTHLPDELGRRLDVSREGVDPR